MERKQQAYLRNELRREVAKLVIPLVAGIAGLVLFASLRECPSGLILLGVVSLGGIGLGIFLAQLVDFAGSFLPYYFALKKLEK